MDNFSGSKLLVTGGAGYIGSHVVKKLVGEGFLVVVMDDLSSGHEDIVRRLGVKFVKGNVRDRKLLAKLFDEHVIGAVLHFASFLNVGESVGEPLKYYANNVDGTLSLLEIMRERGVDKIVFSSTCATYGHPSQIPITEDHPQQPVNSYGWSKLFSERMILDGGRAHGLRSTIFRYFNAAGADPEGNLGEDHNPETHLIPLALAAAADPAKVLSIFGTDYPTPDGTCVRDYVHVEDLAAAHVLGLKRLIKGGDAQTFNLGNGKGFSVRDVVAAVEKVTGKKIHVEEKGRRAGDPATLLGSNLKAKRLLSWEPTYPHLDEIISHAWKWHQTRHFSC